MAQLLPTSRFPGLILWQEVEVDGSTVTQGGANGLKMERGSRAISRLSYSSLIE